MVTVDHCEQEHGFAIIFAIAATALISAAVLLAGNHLQSRYDAHKTELRDVKLIASSDAAMAETLARIAADRNFEGINQRDFDDTVIESSVTWQDDRVFVIVVKSTRGSWAATVKASGHLTTDGPLIDHWERHKHTVRSTEYGDYFSQNRAVFYIATQLLIRLLMI